jgi:aspartyl-tRNA synthetase
MAGTVFFEAAKDSNIKKVLKAAEEDSRQGMRDHFEQFKGRKGCLLSSLWQDESGLYNSVLKKCPPEVRSRLAAALSDTTISASGSGLAAGFLAFGPRDFVLPLLGRLRNELAKSLVPDLAARSDAFTWVVDFPLFVIGKQLC